MPTAPRADNKVEQEEQEDINAQMEKIVMQYESVLLRYATRILNNPTAAEDIVQNVFVKLFKMWRKGMKPSDKLQSWLYSVTHNEAVDYIRRETKLSNLHEKASAELAITHNTNCNTASNEMNDEERRELVLALIRKLYFKEQQVILLRLQEGLSYQQIAEITGLTPGNVGKILHNATHKLSQIIQQYMKTG
jgi:RNA polymerase sigma-70 factor (ECF subfamily)